MDFQKYHLFAMKCLPRHVSNVRVGCIRSQFVIKAGYDSQPLHNLFAMNQSASYRDLYVRIPDGWQEAPEACTRSQSCPLALMAFGPASPPQHRHIPASQPASPTRFPRRNKVSQNRSFKSLGNCIISLADSLKNRQRSEIDFIESYLHAHPHQRWCSARHKRICSSHAERFAADLHLSPSL